jgi:hypothetical protein
MKTAVETIFVGKDRVYNRRFLQCALPDLVEPTAARRLPAGRRDRWRTRVGMVRERFFKRLRFKSYEEMNAWLLDRCVAHAKAHRHPEFPDQTIWRVFEGRAANPGPSCRALRRLAFGAGRGVEDLPQPTSTAAVQGGLRLTSCARLARWDRRA